MTPYFRNLSIVAVAAFLGLAAPFAAQAQSGHKPPSAADFGRQAAIQNVSISPDGKHIAGVTSQDGKTPSVSIWRTDAPNQPPKILGAQAPNVILGVQFIKNDRVAVRVRQTYTSGANKTHLTRLFFVDFDGKTWRNALGGENQDDYVFAQMLDTLPHDPRNVLVASTDGIYKIDVYSGKASRVFASSDKYGSEQVDRNGEVRARLSVDFENGKVYIAQWIRNPTNNQWEEHFRWFAADREPREIIGFTPDPNIVYVRSSAGRDKAAIYEYDIAQRKLLEPIFETKLFDATGVIQDIDSNLLGFTYDGDTQKEYWIDPKLASVTKGLRQAMGIKTVPVDWTDIATGEKARFTTADGADITLSSWSDDRSRAIVVKNGPSQPSEYYLLTDGGKLTLLGKSRPWLDTATLGDARLVQYKARDGLIIPAFLYTPKKEVYGPGPYPAIVVPHGGPWARDYLNWDSSGWTQYFAARGYAVLQPQFRGSEGWGQKLWRAGDAEWGQKMQDDKDDGAKWMIEQKIAAPDRIAMHGYSYGGYSAMAAAVRPNGLYQCAIAGAGVAELARIRESIVQNRIGRELQRPTILGLSPLDHAKDIKIPLFLYSGDRDVTVSIKESERFYAAARSSGQPVKFLVLKDMGHQYSVWEAGQAEEVLLAVDDYLKKDCGPGGL